MRLSTIDYHLAAYDNRPLKHPLRYFSDPEDLGKVRTFRKSIKGSDRELTNAEELSLLKILLARQTKAHQASEKCLIALMDEVSLTKAAKASLTSGAEFLEAAAVGFKEYLEFLRGDRGLSAAKVENSLYDLYRYYGHCKTLESQLLAPRILELNKYEEYPFQQSMKDLSVVSDAEIDELLNFKKSMTSDEKQKKLIEAARGAHSILVKMLLANGADINGKGAEGETALSAAMRLRVMLGDSTDHTRILKMERTVKLLLAHGADVNAADKYGQKPLHYVSKINYANAKLFCSYCPEGERFRTSSRINRSHPDYLLHSLAEKDASLLETLIVHGAEVNATGAAGQTALHKAVELGDAKAVDTLLTYGSAVNAEDSNSQTVLHIAAERCKPVETKSMLLQGAAVNAKDKSGKTALVLAAESSYDDDRKQATLIELLASGADIASM